MFDYQYCEELFVKNSGNQGTWNFLSIPDCKDAISQGPDNQAPAVQFFVIFLFSILSTMLDWDI